MMKIKNEWDMFLSNLQAKLSRIVENKIWTDMTNLKCRLLFQVDFLTEIDNKFGK